MSITTIAKIGSLKIGDKIQCGNCKKLNYKVTENYPEYSVLHANGLKGIGGVPNAIEGDYFACHSCGENLFEGELV